VDEDEEIAEDGVPPQEGEDYEARPGAFHLFENENSRVGTLAGGDLSSITSTIDTTIRAVARNAEVPMHSITGEFPSGAALYQSEMGLNFKAEQITDGVSQPWGAVGYWALKLANLFAGKTFNLDEMLQAAFDSVARLDPVTLAAFANSIKDEISNKEYLKLVGYEEADITRIQSEREAEQKAKLDQEQSLAEAALTRFNRTQVPPSPEPPAPIPPS
jgi:hypothetical protein